MDKERARRSAIEAALERGWATLEELILLAAGSPVDMDEAISLAQEAGIDVAETEGDAWEDFETLSERGPEAFAIVPESPPPVEEIMAGGPAALYLREISKTPLLTAEQEVRLAQELEAGLAARTRLEQEVDDPVVRERLEDAVQVGDAARKRLTESNLRLVVSVARKYLGRGVSFLDLVQEGNIGLQRGAEKYDWRRGFRFSTYAYWWIRQAVSRAVADQGRTIRLPVHIFEQLSRLYSAARELEAELGRQPTAEEIGDRLGLAPEKVREAFRAARVPISLETPAGRGEESTLADFVADAASGAPFREAENEVFAESFDRALREYLTPREADVLGLRFGLADGRERTLTEAGEELGISRERVRQIEAGAIRKLRGVAAFRERFREAAT